MKKRPHQNDESIDLHDLEKTCMEHNYQKRQVTPNKEETKAALVKRKKETWRKQELGRETNDIEKTQNEVQKAYRLKLHLITQFLQVNSYFPMTVLASACWSAAIGYSHKSLRRPRHWPK
jgi:hypothetical protein